MLTSKVQNLWQLTFHKADIIWSPYIIKWWIACQRVTNSEWLPPLQPWELQYCKNGKKWLHPLPKNSKENTSMLVNTETHFDYLTSISINPRGRQSYSQRWMEIRIWATEFHLYCNFWLSLINAKIFRSDFSFQWLCVMCLNRTSSNLIRCKLRKYLSYLSRVSDDTLLLYWKVNIC